MPRLSHRNVQLSNARKQKIMNPEKPVQSQPYQKVNKRAFVAATLLSGSTYTHEKNV